MANDNPVSQPSVAEAPELLPCRFCGRQSRIEDFFIDDDPQPWYVATCTICPIKTYDQQTPEEAARVWNARVAPASSITERRIAALNEIETALISIADGVDIRTAVQRAFDVINREREADIIAAEFQ